VLLFSGGIDSQVMLETFLENNLRIDEICSFANNDVQDKNVKFNQEIFNAAVPFINTLDLNKLGTKYRLVNIGKIVTEQMSDEYHLENFKHLKPNF
jgi:7-cyano-7-deazaguanine synthase in queuosine biosynthesis